MSSSSRHHRRTDQSPTQNVDVPCVVCEELVRCVVEYGLFEEVLIGCINSCEKDSDYPMDELEARAINAALVERHDYEWSARDLCGYDAVDR